MTRIVLFCQGLYYVLSGFWPLVSMSTFEAVTGPKTDDWLVHSVGLLLGAIGAALLLGARRAAPGAETLTLALGAALALIAVEVFYVASETISSIYLIDAALEAIFVVASIHGLTRKMRDGR